MTRQRIGGDNLSQDQRAPYLKKLRELPIVHAHWPFQCRCGTYGWVVYRGRNYCPRCGRRYADDPIAASAAGIGRRALARSGCAECVAAARR
jgi:hypothetical protein